MKSHTSTYELSTSSRIFLLILLNIDDDASKMMGKKGSIIWIIMIRFHSFIK